MKIIKSLLIISAGFSLMISCTQQQSGQQPKSAEQKSPDEEKVVLFTDTTAKTEDAVTGKDQRIEGHKWILIQLLGQRVEVARSTNPAFIRFDPVTSKFSGHGSCNSIFGNYKILEGEMINFSEMGGTKMACPDMTIENKFLEVLSKTGTYRVTESELIFYKEKTDPIAVFALVKE
jgi:heat shock protein HslJ